MNKVDIQSINLRILTNSKVTKSTNHQNDTSKTFADFLKQAEERSHIKFSKHALDRMDKRGISLDDCEITKINEAINKASKKGVKDALILMEDKAFIASVRNKTIVTTVNKDQLKNNIFTNIDGAIII